jgi:hypothetical protein
MEELLKKILEELKLHSIQHAAIIEALGKHRNPSGKELLAIINPILDTIPKQARSHPAYEALLKKMQEVAKNGQ